RQAVEPADDVPFSHSPLREFTPRNSIRTRTRRSRNSNQTPTSAIQKKDSSTHTSSDEKKSEQNPVAQIASKMGWGDGKAFWEKRKNLVFGQIRPDRKKGDK